MTLRREDHGRVALLELNRPEARNALSSVAIAALLEELERIAADDRIGCVVLAGAGPAFCAGADLKELASLDDAGFAAFLQRYAAIGDALRSLGRPVIAAVHGYAIAGGFELMCQCDLRVVADDAVLRVGDLDIGLSPTGGLTHILPRLVGAGRARLLLFAGEAVQGDEAVAIGLAERALPAIEVRAEALRIAELIAAHPGIGVRRTRDLLDGPSANAYSSAVEAEFAAELETFAHPEARAAIAAFTRRRAGD
ncbi:MAG: enoyl-CoA hydratase/isomerase family protein [Gaiellales bacterium]